MTSDAGRAVMPPGWRHIGYGDVQSTNTLAIDAGRAGAVGQLWITGERQLAGRGRQGRPWVSERGNLYASALLIAPPDASGLQTLPLVTGLAVVDMIETLMPSFAPNVRLKWPNDVLIGGAKVAGILIEAQSVPNGLAIAVGCGINLAHAPRDTPCPATCLGEHGPAPEPMAALSALSAAFVDRLSEWCWGAGHATIARQWRSRAAGIGERIIVRLPHTEMTGRFAELDDQGYLILETDDGARETIAAGDVFFERN